MGSRVLNFRDRVPFRPACQRGNCAKDVGDPSRMNPVVRTMRKSWRKRRWSKRLRNKRGGGVLQPILECQLKWGVSDISEIKKKE